MFLQVWVNAKLVWGCEGGSGPAPISRLSGAWLTTRGRIPLHQQHLIPTGVLPPVTCSSCLLSALTPQFLSPLCLPVWHSDGFASLAPHPPTLFHSLRLDSFILARRLSLSALLVTELSGTAPGRRPVIHSAQQTCKHSLPCQTLHPLPTSGLAEPCPGCHFSSPQSPEHLWNSAGLVPAPDVSALPMHTVKGSKILWVRNANLPRLVGSTLAEFTAFWAQNMSTLAQWQQPFQRHGPYTPAELPTTPLKTLPGSWGSHYLRSTFQSSMLPASWSSRAWWGQERNMQHPKCSEGAPAHQSHTSMGKSRQEDGMVGTKTTFSTSCTYEDPSDAM